MLFYSRLRYLLWQSKVALRDKNVRNNSYFKNNYFSSIKSKISSEKFYIK